MKSIFSLIILFTSSFIAVAQNNKDEKISINFGLSHSILNEHRFKNQKYRLDPEIEVLANFRLAGNTKLSTGIGLQYGKYAVTEGQDVRKINDGLTPPIESAYNYWTMNFLSVETPVYITTPIQSSFLDSYRIGIRFGWLWKYDFSEEIELNISDEEINRLFLDYCIGLNKELLRFNKISIGLSPFFGYRGYLSDRNDWQNNYLFYELKISVGF